MLDLSEAGADSIDAIDQPTKRSSSAAAEDTWNDTESEASEQQSRRVQIYYSLCGFVACMTVLYNIIVFPLCTLLQLTLSLRSTTMPCYVEDTCLCTVVFCILILI